MCFTYISLGLFCYLLITFMNCQTSTSLFLSFRFFSIERLVDGGRIESFSISLVSSFDWLASASILYTWSKCVYFKINLSFKFIRIDSFWLLDCAKDTIDTLIMISNGRNDPQLTWKYLEETDSKSYNCLLSMWENSWWLFR